jgi:hypothetical protein
VEVEMTAAATPMMGSVTNQTIVAQEPTVLTATAAAALPLVTTRADTRTMESAMYRNSVLEVRFRIEMFTDALLHNHLASWDITN